MPSSSSKAFAPSPSSAKGVMAAQMAKDQKMALAEQLVFNLCNSELREEALTELSKIRDMFQDLAPMLWNSFGTIAVLLKEIITIYPALSPPSLTSAASNRVCNVLTLLQCVASHPETRMRFLNAHIPLYLYPFLNTKDKSRPFEYLRLTSLGVIGGLVKVESPEVIIFLLDSEVIPLCLQSMEIGTELSKTVATFIVHKVLQDDVGLNYICATPERFFAMGSALASMVISLVDQPSARLLKHIIRCYLRLSNNPRACTSLKTCLPAVLKDGTFYNHLKEDTSIQQCLQQLLAKVSDGINEGAPALVLQYADAVRQPDPAPVLQYADAVRQPDPAPVLQYADAVRQPDPAPAPVLQYADAVRQPDPAPVLQYADAVRQPAPAPVLQYADAVRQPAPAPVLQYADAVRQPSPVLQYADAIRKPAPAPVLQYADAVRQPAPAPAPVHQYADAVRQPAPVLQYADAVRQVAKKPMN